MNTDEEKISRLYQQHKNEAANEAPNEMPPAQLDSDILKAAHQAVEKKSSKVKSPFSGGWPAAASIAAVLIITVIIIPLVKQEAEMPTTESIIDKKMEALNKEDVIGQSINAREIKLEADRQATMQSEEKAKKQSFAKEQTRRLAPTLSSRERSSEITQEQAFAIEEATLGETMPEVTMTPMATDIVSPSQSAKPESVTMGKSNLNDNDINVEAEFQQSAPMTATNKASAVSLTPKLWLEKIQQLIKQGKLDLAQEELNQFKSMYPDEAIDQSILNSLVD